MIWTRMGSSVSPTPTDMGARWAEGLIAEQEELELADHQRLTLATNVEVYFCDPKSPWQRGSNENTNRLLRQYFPRGTDLSLYSQAKLSAVARYGPPEIMNTDQ